MSDNLTEICQHLLENLQFFPIQGQPDTCCREPSPRMLAWVERQLERIRTALSTALSGEVSESIGWTEYCTTEALSSLWQVVDRLVAYLVAAEDAESLLEFPKVPSQVFGSSK
jgi:hypothetical protein